VYVCVCKYRCLTNLNWIKLPNNTKSLFIEMLSVCLIVKLTWFLAVELGVSIDGCSHIVTGHSV
jgi:hypothetical protein